MGGVSAPISVLPAFGRRIGAKAPPAGGHAQSGFTYLGLLIAIAILGVGLAATGEVWRTVQQREKERELLFVGNQFRKAIELYYERSPGGAKKFPRSLEALLKDERYPTTQRYLRRIYADPMTEKAEWGIVKAPDGGIAGVHSLSQERPFKVANFSRQDAGLGHAEKYADWQFFYKPAAPPVRSAPPVRRVTVVPPAAATSPGPTGRP